MNVATVSFLVGASFGFFLTIQYVIFVLFLSKRDEIKKTKEDLFYIILIGIAICLAGIFGYLSQSGEFQALAAVFRKAQLIGSILTVNFYVMLLRFILLSIKDMTFVETDEYKGYTRRYLIFFTVVSVAAILAVALFDITSRPFSRPGFPNFMNIPSLAYLALVIVVESLQFQKILRKEIGKITPINFLRYVTIYGSGMIALLFSFAEITFAFFNRTDTVAAFGSFFMYGMGFLAVGLSLNLIFEYMEVLTRVSETNKKLTDLNRKIMDDVRTAQSLQISLLPLDKQKVIQSHVDMEISYMPMQSVGGDYYDFYLLDENKVLLFIGDASGHGVYAAMIWAMLKVEVEELIEDQQFTDLSQAFTTLNQRITRILENTYSYATLFSCLIDLSSSTVSYISAGHTDQLFFSLEGEAVNRIRNKNPIIGTFKNAQFNADTISYKPGDMLLLFSDGIVEGTNPEGEQLGKERLENMLLEVGQDTANSANASLVIGNLLIKLEEFFEGTIQKDDRTLMVIKL